MLPKIFEKENVYINETYLINGFDKRLWLGVLGVSVRTRQPGWTRLGGCYTTYTRMRLHAREGGYESMIFILNQNPTSSSFHESWSFNRR